MNTQRQRIEELLEIKNRRLHELRKQQAMHGVDTSPNITMEIESLDQDIRIMYEALTTAQEYEALKNKNAFSGRKLLRNTVILFISLVSVIGVVFLIYLFRITPTPNSNALTIVPSLEETSEVKRQQTTEALLQPTIITLQTEVALNNSVRSPQNIPEDITALLNDAMKWNVFTEDFNNNRNQWIVSSNQGINHTINRRYRWEILSAKGYVEQEILKNHDRVRNFYLTVDVQKLKGNDDTGYGLLFRYNYDSSQQEERYYGFVINNQSEYMIFRGDNLQQTPLLTWKKSPHINPGEVNELKILATGDRFVFFINNFYIDEILETTYKEGGIGLWALSNPNEDLIVEFDNIKLYIP